MTKWAYGSGRSDYYQRRRDPERLTRRLVHQLEQLGHTVTITPAA